jgi:hypothetical protein
MRLIFLFHAAPPAIVWLTDHETVVCFLSQSVADDGIVVAKPITYKFLAVNHEMLETELMEVIQLGIALTQSSVVRLLEHWNALEWRGYS